MSLRDFFFQIILAIIAAIIGLVGQLLPGRREQKIFLGILGVLLLIIAAAWSGYELKRFEVAESDTNPESTTNPLAQTASLIQTDAPPESQTTQSPSDGYPDGYYEGELLFDDNFENGRLENWKLNTVGWNIIIDETGNHILQGIGSQNYETWRNIEMGNSQWQNYALDLRIRVEEFGKPPFGQAINIEFRKNLHDGDNFYSLNLNETFINIVRSSSGGFTTLRKIDGFDLPLGTWFKLRLEVTDDFIRGFIDGLLVIESGLGVPHERGIIGFTAPPTNVLWLDDIEVTKLIKASGN